MSMVMFVVGCLAVMVGAAMVGYGIPVNEFSFGNTLITAGTTLAAGGLVVVAISAAVSQLQRIAEALAARGLIQPGRPIETSEQPSDAREAPAIGRIPFPPKSAKSPMREPYPPPLPADMAGDMAADMAGDMAGEERPHQSFAPSLRNPEAQPLTVEDEVSLSPTNGSGVFAPRHEPAMDESWRSPPPPHEAPSSYFDTMWPAAKAAKPPSRGPAAGEPMGEPMGEPRPEPSPRDSVARMAAPEPAPAPASPPRTAAILKSGVVDGMGYTLYVDGSIEAELPQGTLRFASIDELRSHLEKSN